MKRRPKLVTYRTDSDNPLEAFAFRVIAGNGEQAGEGEGYTSRRAARKAGRKLISGAYAGAVGALPPEPSEPRSRTTYREFRKGDRFVLPWDPDHELRDMFNHTAYLVGSSLTRPDYRDVDVRIIVPEATFDQLAEVVDMGRLHLALSLWGAHVTGLPIDCQVQSRTATGDEPGPIRPIGRTGRRLDGEAWKDHS